jgi:hypothetical protein
VNRPQARQPICRAARVWRGCRPPRDSRRSRSAGAPGGRPVRARRRRQASVSASCSSGRQRTRPPPEGQLHSVYLFGIPSPELRPRNSRSGLRRSISVPARRVCRGSSGLIEREEGDRCWRVPQGTIESSHGAQARGKRVSARIIFPFGAPGGAIQRRSVAPGGAPTGKRGGHGPPGQPRACAARAPQYQPFQVIDVLLSVESRARIAVPRVRVPSFKFHVARGLVPRAGWRGG